MSTDGHANVSEASYSRAIFQMPSATNAAMLAWAPSYAAKKTALCHDLSLCSPSLFETDKSSPGDHLLLSASIPTTACLTLASVAAFMLADNIWKMASPVAFFRRCVCAFLHKEDASLPW